MSADQIKWPIFAEKFSELLEVKGVTMYQIDEKTPLRSSNLSKIKAGTKRPTDEVCFHLSQYEPLGVSFMELVAWRAADEYGLDVLRNSVDQAITEKLANADPKKK